MSFETEVLAGFEAALRLYRTKEAQSCVMLWKDKPYDVIGAPSPDGTALLAGGFIADYAFSVAGRRVDFPTLPKSGDPIVKGGRKSKILKVEPSDISPLVVFHCGTPDR